MAAIQPSHARMLLLPLLLLAACDTTGPRGQGALRVTTVTTGADLDDQYELAGPVGGVAIGSNASVVWAPLDAGEMGVELYDVADNCTVRDANPRTLSIRAGDTVATTYRVECVAATAHIEIRISTTGVDRDINGYAVWVDPPLSSFPDGPRNDLYRVDSLIVFPKVPPGAYRVTLRDVAANCAARPDTTQLATLTAGDTLRVTWAVDCARITDRRLLYAANPGPYNWVTPSGPSEIYVRNPGDTVLSVTWIATGRGARCSPGAGWSRDGSSGARWSPDGSAIVFVRETSGNNEIYVVSPDGAGAVTNLTNNPAGDWSPAWSPDGTQIAFVSNRDGNTEIYVMKADGSGQTRLTSDTAPDAFPTWSPDGTRLMFLRGCLVCGPAGESEADVYVMDPDGSHVTRLTTGASAFGPPEWSPDGARIAFTSNGLIALMDSDGSHPILARVPGGFQVFGGLPTWSPDGSLFAFSNGDGIYVASSDGSNATKISSGGWYPKWSPDGLQIAFLYTTCLDFDFGLCSSWKTELKLMRSDGAGVVLLTRDAGVNGLDWSPR